MALLGLVLAALFCSTDAEADMLSITPGSPILLPGQSEVVSVSYAYTGTTGYLLRSVDLEIGFDSSRFAVSNIVNGNIDSSFNLTPGTPTASEISTSADSANGVQIAVGETGTLLMFTITALSNAPLGDGLINLQTTFNRSTTALNESITTFTPAVTNGVDAGVDAYVTVASTTVPEPASLVLVAMGGGLAILAARRKTARRPQPIAAP